ncbi:MAG TPA: hypothetical protein VL990_16100 [Acidobacteriaceae bacterium]|nr:hypothetical protein [Acidobacteriaceae bacterium]
MAVRIIQSPIEILDATGEPVAQPSRTVSGLTQEGEPEINLGAFRGLAFALIFETVFVLLGGVAWEVFRALF